MDDLDRQVLALCASPQTSRTIASALHISIHDVQASLRALHSEGLIRSERKKWRATNPADEAKRDAVFRAGHSHVCALARQRANREQRELLDELRKPNPSERDLMILDAQRAVILGLSLDGYWTLVKKESDRRLT